MRHLDANVRALTAPIKRTDDRYEDMIIEAAEGEGDGRYHRIFSSSMFRVWS
jgi:hypothetical protein